MSLKIGAVAFLFGIGASFLPLPAQRPAAAQTMPSPSATFAAVEADRQEMNMSTPRPTSPLKITFADKSAEWTPEKLAGLPHKTITVYNEHVKASQTYSGVELIELLKPLGVPEKPRGKDFRLYVVVEGSDGYEVVYSLGEITPDVHDGTTLVADSRDGKPIADTGPLQLVTTGERRPARWVHTVVAIRVMTAE